MHPPTCQSTIFFNIISYITRWHCKVIYSCILSFSKLISSIRHVVTFCINRSVFCSLIIWKIKPLCHWALCRLSGHKSGVQDLIREKVSAAVYVHCASHCLNLVLNHCSQQPPIRNMFTTLSNVINVFNDSKATWQTRRKSSNILMWNKIHTAIRCYNAFRWYRWCCTEQH